MVAGDPSPLDRALDELYATLPAEFVATRARLAAGLRAAGDPNSAKQLGQAHRPTNAAWALNQLVRRRPEVVDELLARSDAVRAAQARAAAGAPPGGGA